MRLGTQIPTFGDPRHPGGNSVPQKFQSKKGEKSKIPTSPRAAELGGENEGKTGKIGIQVVLCEVLAAGEREEGGKLGISQGFGIFPGIWESPG